MEPAGPTDAAAEAPKPRIDWESFYRNYRKPGYVPGYEVIHKLGGGMFGLVFKARKESIGKDYAVKFLKVDDETIRDAVRRELLAVELFAQIDHPNLVSIEDKGEVDGIPYLVMGYAGQETLQKRLEQGRLPREEAMRLFVQAVRGTQALHDHSLVHFDLKPANVFLKGDVARVGDYGLSKLVTESRNSLSFGRGTPYYMAPEMLQRRGDARSDVYSLGVILFECLSGDVPFRGDSEWEVLRKHETAPVPWPADMTPGDRAVLQRCLAKDPAQRYANAGELLRALQAPVALGESVALPRVAAVPAAPLPRAPHVPPPLPQPAAVPPPLPSRPGSAPAVRPGADAWRPALGDKAAADSLRGMPWRGQARARGIVPLGVATVFLALEAVAFVAMLPIRFLTDWVGPALLWLLRLPLRVLGLAAHAVAWLVAVGMFATLVAIAVWLVRGG